MCKVLDYFNPFCKPTGFLNGDKLNVCDFWVGGLYTNMLMVFPFWTEQGNWDRIKTKYPEYCAYGERFIQTNKKYLDSRPKCGF